MGNSTSTNNKGYDSDSGISSPDKTEGDLNPNIPQ